MSRTTAPSAPQPFARILPWLYLVGGATGLIAAFTLMIEKLETLRNTEYVPTCSLNPVVSCGSVMESWQAEVFGFPNPIIGIAAFPVLITVGVVMLANITLPRWFYLGLQIGTTLGVAFVIWLIYSSLYEIHALCPYCMVVWVVVITLFWYTTLYNLGHGALGVTLPSDHPLLRFHSTLLMLWFLIIIGLILENFWDYWSTLL